MLGQEYVDGACQHKIDHGVSRDDDEQSLGVVLQPDVALADVRFESDLCAHPSQPEKCV
jgi:hypothetical protein